MTKPLGQRSYEADAATLKVTLNIAHPFARAVSAHLALPGLRAFWPMSAVDYQRPECTDLSGHGYDLQSSAALGDVTFGYDGTQVLAPIAVFGGGAAQYLSRADGGAGNWADIRGNEASIQSADQGLTVGGWFRFDGAAAAQEVLISKGGGGVANTSYWINRQATGEFRFTITDGAARHSAISTATLAATTWYHLVGRFEPSTEAAAFIDGAQDGSDAAGIPATLLDTAISVNIGSYNDSGLLPFSGYASMCFLYATLLSDTQIQALYNQTRELYGV